MPLPSALGQDREGTSFFRVGKVALAKYGELVHDPTARSLAEEVLVQHAIEVCGGTQHRVPGKQDRARILQESTRLNDLGGVSGSLRAAGPVTHESRL